MNVFESVDKVFSNLTVSLTGGYSVLHSAGWFEKRTKINYTIWNITNGCINIKINGKMYFAKSGDVVLFYPGDTYTAESNEECSFLYLFFKLESGKKVDVLSNVKLSGIYSKNYLGETVERFCIEFGEKRKKSPTNTVEMYSILLRHIVTLISLAKEGRAMLFYDNILESDSSELGDAIRYINEHFADNLKIKDVAQKFNLSEKHFINKFAQLTGVSPKKYIIQCRMNLAAELLYSKKNSITEISKMLGYADQYAFSKAFKKYYGESPSFHRNKNKQC